MGQRMHEWQSLQQARAGLLIDSFRLLVTQLGDPNVPHHSSLVKTLKVDRVDTSNSLLSEGREACDLNRKPTLNTSCYE